MHVDLKNLDLPLLLRQKQALLRAIKTSSADDALHLDGILSLLDYIHDTIDPPDPLGEIKNYIKRKPDAFDPV